MRWGRRTRGLLWGFVAGFRRIRFLYLLSEVVDLTLKSFYLFFHFFVEMLPPRSQLWKEQHRPCPDDDP